MAIVAPLLYTPNSLALLYFNAEAKEQKNSKKDLLGDGIVIVVL